MATANSVSDPGVTEFIMSISASARSGIAASRIEWLCRRIHTATRGHVIGRGIVVSACSVTAVNSIMVYLFLSRLYKRLRPCVT